MVDKTTDHRDQICPRFKDCVGVLELNTTDGDGGDRGALADLMKGLQAHLGVRIHFALGAKDGTDANEVGALKTISCLLGIMR